LILINAVFGVFASKKPNAFVAVGEASCRDLAGRIGEVGSSWLNAVPKKPAYTEEYVHVHLTH
jgi:hypothetical protein